MMSSIGHGVPKWMNEGNPLEFSTFIRAVTEQDLTV
jgi:hypothetical protein